MMTFANIGFRNLNTSDLSDPELYAIKSNLEQHLQKVGELPIDFPLVQSAINHLDNYIKLCISDTDSAGLQMVHAIRCFPEDKSKLDSYYGTDSRILFVHKVLSDVDYKNMPDNQLAQLLEERQAQLLHAKFDWERSVDATTWATLNWHKSKALACLMKIAYLAQDTKNAEPKTMHSLEVIQLFKLYKYFQDHPLKNDLLQDSTLSYFYLRAIAHIYVSLDNIKKELAKHDIREQLYSLKLNFIYNCVGNPDLGFIAYQPGLRRPRS